MARQPRPAARTRRSKRAPAIAFDAITLEGGLIAPAMLAQIARIEADEQSAADYGVARGLILRDEIARAYRIAQAHYADLTAHPEPSLAATQRFTAALLREVLEFRDLIPVERHDRDGDIYPVTFEGLGGRVPVVVVTPADGIDRVSSSLTAAGRRGSAASVVQDWLNAEDAALWGLACCGTRLRLLRDNPSLTRPAYIEADLDAIFTNEGRVDFAVLWLLLHATRFGKPTDAVAGCTLERWRLAGLKEGEVARDRLRDGVEEALIALGTGFLSHPANQELRKFVGSGVIPAQAYFEQCLHLVYRLIFLFVAEDRDLLHPRQTAAIKRQRYAQGYSVGVLRQASVRRSAYDAHADRWEALQVVFRGLTDGEEELGLPALSGLFEPGRMDDLECCTLANRDLMKAVHRLAWLKGDDGILPVNWRDMQTEELGSVYESLLELAPRISPDGREMVFAVGSETKGNARKTTGSYYTPDTLVQALLNGVTDPVMDQAVAAANDQVRALLELRIIDPACGSGHFLLAAARRLAARVARARSGGVASADQYREAMRDVVRRCVYGVDRNPMAVDLAKVALWIESIEPGKPLGFLDANIVCGDALLGTFSYGRELDVQLDEGIPDEAYKALKGDDPATCRKFLIANRDVRNGQGSLCLDDKNWRPSEDVAARLIQAFNDMPEDTARQRKERQKVWEQAMSDPGLVAKRQAADLYIYSFLAPKFSGEDPEVSDIIPTSSDINSCVNKGKANKKLLDITASVTEKARVMHWGLTFADIFEAGGFDIVVGNPPWDRIKIHAQEHFAARDPEIASAPTAAERDRLIEALAHAPENSRKRMLHAEFEQIKRNSEAASLFVRIPKVKFGRFPLTGRGDVNTYALFAELFSRLISPRGRAGLIAPTGIATDNTCKAFFGSLIDEKRVRSLFSFYEIRRWFKGTDDRKEFCLLTLSSSDNTPAEFLFSAESTDDWLNLDRRFTLTADQISVINPNSKTAPVFRSRADASLSAKIYSRVPVLIDRSSVNVKNEWQIKFYRMFDMSNDSRIFKNFRELEAEGFVADGLIWKKALPDYSAAGDKSLGSTLSLFSDSSAAEASHDVYVPLYEGKMVHHYDHRFGDARTLLEKSGYSPLPRPTPGQLMDHSFEVCSWFYVPQTAAIERFDGWQRDWLLGWRDITHRSSERTVVASVFPCMAAANNLPHMTFGQSISPRLIAALYANLTCIVLDFCARHKVGGLHLNFFIFEQLPILSPDAYSEADLEYISGKVLELVYTSGSMSGFARDIGYEGPPFTWSDERRALLRAEIDAWYAVAYGLSREDLVFILDPEVARGADYPSETFRVLKDNETKAYGEFRTAKMVLEAFDKIVAGSDVLAAAE